MRAIILFLEYFGVFAFAGLLVFVPLTKLAMGSLLTFGEAFLPNVGSTQKDSSATGRAEVKMWQVLFKLSGTLRFAVIVGGLILLVGAILEGHENYVADSGKRLEKQISRSAERLDPESKKRIDEMIRKLSKGQITEPHADPAVID